MSRQYTIFLLSLGTALLTRPVHRAVGQAIPQCQEARLTASVPMAYGRFGSSVAISGDKAIASSLWSVGAEVCGGAPSCGTGSAFVYHQDGHNWIQQAELRPPDGLSYFAGGGVSISGDVAVVGELFDSSTGAAYVFRRNGTNWLFDTKLRASDGLQDDHFGQRLAIRGNLLVVGASGVDCAAGESCGAAYVFRYDGAAWIEEGKLTPWDNSRSQFGVSLGIDGDRIIVGAWLDSLRCYRCGSAFVFRYDAGKWVPEKKLIAFDAESYDEFGFSVGMSADGILVGARGSAYLFRRTGTDWVFENKLVPSDGAPDWQFGGSVDLDGSLGLVGSAHGSHLFQRGVGGWTEVARLSASDHVTSFGSPVALDQGYAIAGAWQADFAGPLTGAAYVFRLFGLPDVNGNGINDTCEPDCNANGVPDDLDILGGIADCDGNGIPDLCEPDCNTNNRPDACDIAAGTSQDCTCNGIPDECEPDCNSNDSADSCDISAGRSQDCSGNHIPDECEPDCNENGVADSCDIRSGQSADCNHNGVPDSCDILAGTSQDCSGDGVPDECDQDCNLNGTPDSCDIHSGNSPDIDADGIPDECESWSHCLSGPGYFDYGPHRINVLAEFLGMLIADELRAPDAMYDRIVRDLALLDLTYPILRTVSRLSRGMNGVAVKLNLALPHDGFDALNAYYQGVSNVVWFMPEWNWVTFCDTLNTEAVRDEYLHLPEVVYVEHGADSGHNYNGDYVDLTVDGDIYVYEFSNGEGDCPSGCCCRQTWRFAVAPEGSASLIEYGPGPCSCDLPNEGDFDSDGVMDCLDPCPAAEDGGTTDSDGDGVGDLCDACVLTIPGASVDAAGCPPPTPGDIDRDGDVADEDYVRFRNCLRGPGITGCGYPEILVYLDSDWDVDLRDLSIFQNCFSGANVPGDPSCGE